MIVWLTKKENDYFVSNNGNTIKTSIIIILPFRVAVEAKSTTVPFVKSEMVVLDK